VVYSDTLSPTQVTAASQALTVGDSAAVTALSGLPLTSQVAGGTLQALIAFKGAGPYTQITGDAATSNLAKNEVAGSVGTLGPNTICTTPDGIAYISPDGLRVITLAGTTTPVIGDGGEGVALPFISVDHPSRMCAAFNEQTFRVSVQNLAANGDPTQEYWFDIKDKTWSGPHTFPADLIEAYHGTTAFPFIHFANGINGKLWSSSTKPLPTASYTENGVALSFVFQSALLPDNEEMAMNAVVETTLAYEAPSTQMMTVLAADESGQRPRHRLPQRIVDRHAVEQLQLGRGDVGLRRRPVPPARGQLERAPGVQAGQPAHHRLLPRQLRLGRDPAEVPNPGVQAAMRKLILAALAVVLTSCAAPALAANCAGYPYTLTNGTTADANQVMANFNAILACGNNSLAKNGANSDITSLNALSTPLSAAQGGTGQSTSIFSSSNSWSGDQRLHPDPDGQQHLRLRLRHRHAAGSGRRGVDRLGDDDLSERQRDVGRQPGAGQLHRLARWADHHPGHHPGRHGLEDAQLRHGLRLRGLRHADAEHHGGQDRHPGLLRLRRRDAQGALRPEQGQLIMGR
jgi:hypothetical protein